MDEEKKPQPQPEQLSYLKGLLITLAILGFAVIYIFICSALGFTDFWVGLVAVTLWGALGLKMELIPNIWVGAAVGVLIAASLWFLPELLGSVLGMILAFGLIIFALWFMILKKAKILFNDSTFIFLNIFTYQHFATEANTFTFFPDLAMGAIILGLVPFVILKYLSNKKAKDTAAEG
jgi:Flp pilus assembly protein TadB